MPNCMCLETLASGARSLLNNGEPVGTPPSRIAGTPPGVVKRFMVRSRGAGGMYSDFVRATGFLAPRHPNKKKHPL